MKFTWRNIVQLLNDIGHVVEGRERYLRVIPLLKSIEHDYRHKVDGFHQITAQKIANLCKTNGATWIKMAQYLSCRADILPEEYINAFSQLQSMSIPHESVSFVDIIPVLNQAWGNGWEKKFATFNAVPKASASIALVYHATLFSNNQSGGEEVAIKIRVPGVEQLFQQDAIVFKALAKMLKPFFKEIDIVQVVAEIIETTMAELDFSLEKDRINEFSEFKQTSTLAIPELYDNLCTEGVLVTQWVHGIQLQELLKKTQVFDQSTAEKSFTKKSTADTQPIPSSNDKKAQDVVKRLVESMIQQMFSHGVFHGDPHPGNIIVNQADEIYLIDFGFVGHLTVAQRQNYLQLLLALTQKDIDQKKCVQLFQAAGFSAKNPELFETIAAYLQEYCTAEDSVQLDDRMGQLLKAFRKNKVKLPSDFIAIVRVVLILSGQLQQVNVNFMDILYKTKR